MAFTSPLPGFTTVLGGQSRSGTASQSAPVDNTKGFNTVNCQVLTDQTWSTFTDGRHILFTAACSTDGGVTFPWTVGPFGITPPDLGKGGSSPMFAFTIPVNVDHFQASYSVLDVNGATGPSIAFGLAIQAQIT